MAIADDLKGSKVLVTRPQAQAAELTQLITAAGGQAILFPLIEIEPIPPAQWSFIDWRKVDMLIFVSRNAVNYFKQGYPAALPQRLMLIAVGKGTAETMQEQGYAVHLHPTEAGGTEALLACLELPSLANKKVVIVRGQGGRELLANSLRANGAEVRYIEVYKRQAPMPSAEMRGRASEADMVLATSVQSVTNLLVLCADNRASLLFKPLVVMSERIKKYAVSQGFKTVEVTATASDKAILQRLTEIGRDHGK